MTHEELTKIRATVRQGALVLRNAMEEAFAGKALPTYSGAHELELFASVQNYIAHTQAPAVEPRHNEKLLAQKITESVLEALDYEAAVASGALDTATIASINDKINATVLDKIVESREE